MYVTVYIVIFVQLMGELADLSERLARESGQGGFRPATLTSAPVR